MGAADTTVAPPTAAATTLMPPTGADATHRPASRATRATAPPRTHRRPLLLVAALIVVAIVLLARSPQTTVPELRGLSRDGVRARAGRHELKPHSTAATRRARRAASRSSQDPKPGDKVGEGSTVRVTLSDGPAPVAVPQVKGKDIAARAIELDAVGLRARAASARPRASCRAPSSSRRPRRPRAPSPEPHVTLTVVAAAELAHGDDVRRARRRPLGPVPDPRRRAGGSSTGWPQGRCQLLVLCFGPAAKVVGLPAEERIDALRSRQGQRQDAHVESRRRRLPGQRRRGDDPARWSMSVQDSTDRDRSASRPRVSALSRRPRAPRAEDPPRRDEGIRDHLGFDPPARDRASTIAAAAN